MKLSKRIKFELDETRMLILGAQILLGFQFRGVFSETFGELPAISRYLDAAALVLMILVVALLITPGPYHRIVAKGQDDERVERLTDIIAKSALLPFAVALGIDIYIILERIFRSSIAIAAGTAITALALCGWFGLPYASKGRGSAMEIDKDAGTTTDQSATPLTIRIEHMLTEARVVLPGAQALFGFQLSIVLTRSFAELSSAARAIHAASLCLVALAIILLMAPAAYHRIAFGGEESEALHKIGSLMLTAATVPLAAGLAGDVFVVIGKIAGSGEIGLLVGAGTLLLLIGLWHIFPLIARGRRPKRGLVTSGSPGKT